MPSKDEHLNKAKEDERFVLALDTTEAFNLNWAVTALFYAGLHYVEAYFATQNLHSADHRTRDSSIRRDPNTRKLFVEYSDLKNFSINKERQRPRRRPSCFRSFCAVQIV